MRLSPRDQDKLIISQLGFLAQKRLARGLKLNRSEAIALISHQLHERIRDGSHSVADLMQHGKEILGRRHVLPEVVTLIENIQVEGSFHDGVFLVTVHDPICTTDGNLENAFYGSFLPIPSQNLFPLEKSEAYGPGAAPGAVILSKYPIVINKGRDRIKLRVQNHGDRPIQVGSHYHFAETNRKLSFDRGLAYGKRLDIPSGTAVRFEPGDLKTVTLCSIAGNQIVRGGNGHTSGKVDLARREEMVQKLLQAGFSHIPEPKAVTFGLGDKVVDRATYVSMFGPTTGDRVKLGDTGLTVEVEWDATVYGEECKFGGGKTIRDGMGQMSSPAPEALDLVITNALVIDHLGIYKADIGVFDGKIKRIGKAGNPDIQEGITPGMIVAGSTEVVAGENMIVTSGAIDAHVHYICPQQIWEAIASGKSVDYNYSTCGRMFTSVDTMAGNFLFTGKGNDSGREALEDIIKAGAGGLKLHEDWGSTPAAIRNCLDVGDTYDVQFPWLNASFICQVTNVDTIDAFGGRTIHTYHSEGAGKLLFTDNVSLVSEITGGGHAPDIIVVCGHENVLPSSTNPTRPYAKNTLDEHLDMLMVCHHLSRSIAEDVAFAESRIRGQTVAAEDVLQDLGAISMISSDSQAMGRIGEVISRTWRTASKMRAVNGPLVELGDTPDKDNGRVKRYISKYTINPALTHGVSHVVGHIKEGTLADLVLWKFQNFGSKPELVIKGGVIISAQMGDANASIPTVQPILPRPMWGSHPSAAALNSVHFVSGISIESGTIASYGLKKNAIAVRGCRDIKKKHLKWNSFTPKLSVDPESYIVKIGDGNDAKVVTVEPTERTGEQDVLSRLYRS
ncbi:hypothetical protein Clacol_003770 [Clathrus columnatus]|uniref:Urease n=1 Tax=Clathrus columnatus TaxID=1419009 RepID=A0AAV5A7B1_9AGAM|nr:hypothetical protein Clacol_003770 [Clathrus columnatus]